MDNDSLERHVIAALRARGLDVLTTQEAGNRLLPDDEQLAFATSQGRVVFTANRGDFARLHKQWMEAGRSHAGVIARVNQALPVGDQIRCLTRIAGEFEERPTTNMFEYLENWL